MWELFFIAAALASTIPPPQPSASPCLQKCFQEGSLLGAANDLNNFKNIAINIDMFCQVNAAVLKCGRECPDIEELEHRTTYSSFICSEKVEEFRLIKDCMSQAPDVVDSCMQDCGLPAAALRFDSSPAALVSPTVFFDGIGTTCDKHICALKCAMGAFNKACPGTGELFRDMARVQVITGTDRLNATVHHESEANQHVLLNYINNLPSKCAFMQDVELLDVAIKNSEHSTPEVKETTPVTTTEEVKKTSGAVIDFQEDAEVTTMIVESTTLEFEPSNEPDVPIGPPEVGGTVEPSKEVEGQEETDESIIDHDGRENKNFKSTTELPMSSTESETEKMEPSEEHSSETPLETTTLHNPEEDEPVIVIDNSDKKVETNDISDSTAAEVKSGASFVAAVVAVALSVLVAF